MFKQLSVTELKELRDKGEDIELIDVRNPDEYELCNIEGKLIPLGELTDRFSEIDKSKKLVIMCHHGGRSMRACQFLAQQGFENIHNLDGGIHKWSLEVDPDVPTY
jgi:rhodanese-related sulfurtransferase